MREHTGVPPTCGCTDYGVHRALRNLDYQRNAGRVSAQELGGAFKEDYDRRVAKAELELAIEKEAARLPGRINPTPGYLIAKNKEMLDKLHDELNNTYHSPGLFTRIGRAWRAFWGIE